MSTQSMESAKRPNAYPSPPPPQSQAQQGMVQTVAAVTPKRFEPTPVNDLLEGLDCQDPGRPGVKEDEFGLTKFVPDPGRDTSILELSAVMQHVRANRTLRLQHVAYRVAQTWADGLWQLGAGGPAYDPPTSAPTDAPSIEADDPVPVVNLSNDRLVQIMSCILSTDQKKQADALERLANTVVTPELLAEFDGLVDALEACLTHQAFLPDAQAGPCRPRPDLYIAYAAIRLREQAEHAVDESERRRLLDVLAYGELGRQLIANPRVARRLGSTHFGPNPAHVVRWVFRLDKIPMPSFAGEQAQLAAIDTIFQWISKLHTANPNKVKITDELVAAGLVLSKW